MIIRNGPRPLFPILLGLIAYLPALSPAQSNRYEVGLRLQAFEAAWDQCRDDQERRRCLEPLKEATNYFLKSQVPFLSDQIREAGRSLDRARSTLHSPKKPEPASFWADSLSFQPASRLLDTKAKDLPFILGPFYKVPQEQPKEALLRLTLLKEGKTIPTSTQFSIPRVPFQGRLPLKELTDGDYRLRIEVLLRDKPLVCREQGLSFVTNASERIGGLKRDLNAFPSAPRHTDKETGQALLNLLQSLYEGGTEETDVPAAHFLKEAEGIVKTAKTGKTFYGSRKEGQFWLTLPTGQRMTMVRLLAPEAVKEGRSLPLVIALHGLGGSEHLFFEGYGRGTMVRLCQQRSWLLVAPRLDFLKGPLPMREMIAEVNRLYPIDRKRIFLVGHSMGARESVAQLERAPKDFAGVAVLAGGGPLREPQALKNLPFFIGVGQEDPVPLAPGWAYKLEKDLKKAGMEILIFKEYKDIEHLLVVQAALPDIFALFDRVGKP